MKYNVKNTSLIVPSNKVSLIIERPQSNSGYQRLQETALCNCLNQNARNTLPMATLITDRMKNELFIYTFVTL